MASNSESGASIDPEIDDLVFDRVTPLVDTWTSGIGKRLYRLGDGVANHPPLHAFTEYSREIDESTGNLVEQERVQDIGYIQISVSLRNAQSQIVDRLKDGNEELWDELTIEMMQDEFESYLEKRLTNLIRTEDETLLDIHLQSELRFPIDTSEEARRLSEYGSFSTGEWEEFLWAVQKETVYIDRVTESDINGEQSYVEMNDRLYSFVPQFEEPPEWRLRAAENYHCGVFGGSLALANVAALLDDPKTDSQSEIAEILGKGDSTVSRQAQSVKDTYDRVEWTWKNRDLSD